ncbi:DUF5325 family protein [Niallia sp. NCCP-28]|uniref:DUF5325 family protein n=1 Tax=Niallia sp. NCCP-28 TaxID=2934712 RepID=UPI002082F492|nr:DUF5325 family protein [Niallia sp. NCCP-28]GKU82343.1 hypothetical protein NCCP28_17390 [Niallia sp. NCCP-28]
MNIETGPFYYYKIFAASAFILIGICIVEKSLKGAIICFILFLIIVSLAVYKKKRIHYKKKQLKNRL